MNRDDVFDGALLMLGWAGLSYVAFTEPVTWKWVVLLLLYAVFSALYAHRIWRRNRG